MYGSSDKHAALPKDNPVHTKDFVATIYHALGYDGNTRVVDFTGRPHFIVHGDLWGRCSADRDSRVASLRLAASTSRIR